MNHPLTDEICKSIAVCYPYNNRIDIEDCGHLTDMRAAADWQLEQVIEWIKQGHLYDLEYHTHCLDMIADLKATMRPQENNS